MSRIHRLAWQLRLFDLLATCATIILAFTIRFEPNDIIGTMTPYLPAALIPLVVNPFVYSGFGLYRREWGYASVRELLAVAAAVLVSTAIAAVAVVILALLDAGGAEGFPRSVLAIEALLGAALIGGGRFLLRVGSERAYARSGDSPAGVATLVYGAGEAGATTLRLAKRDPQARIRIVGFLDDDRRKAGSVLMGTRIFGGLDDLRGAVAATGATQLLIAMPSASGDAIRTAFDAAQAAGLETRTIPPLRELIQGRVELARIRPVRVEDLLRRDPVVIDLGAVSRYINGASVLVTGGGGSIGSELVRQIQELGPRELVVLDNHEAALWSVERSLSESVRGPADGTHVETVLADVRFANEIDQVIRRTRPDVVFHAAALKHVPIVERYPTGAVLTNVGGTRTVLEACERHSVGRFVFISTDKAVDPASLMGATKRIGELLTQQVARRTGRPYVAVRFGNVLGSSGSVVPTFERQLHAGMPITITHPDVTRYFMTIAEAVSLILQAAALGDSGQLYVLEMGKPVRIEDLARDLVRLSGMNPDEADFVYTGLRPGERLHEQLMDASEQAQPSGHPGIIRVRSQWQTPDEAMDRLVNDLQAAARDADEAALRRLLHEERAALASGEPVGG